MTLSDTDQHRLTELRAEWHRARAAGDAERLMAIEGEAAEITALHLLRTELGAVVIEDSGTEQPPMNPPIKGEHRDGPEPPRDPAPDAGAAFPLPREG